MKVMLKADLMAAERLTKAALQRVGHQRKRVRETYRRDGSTRARAVRQQGICKRQERLQL